MAELTKDDIKEALGFISDEKRKLGTLEKAESAIAVLGQLKALTDSLTVKASNLKEQVAFSEKRNAALAEDWEKAKNDLLAFRHRTAAEIEVEAEEKRNILREDNERLASDLSGEIAELQSAKEKLVQFIVDLSKDRDGIAEDIKSLRKSQAEEQARLDTILAEIAELKSRL